MILCYRFLYAPYQVHKKHGIVVPNPTPFWGNYWAVKKMVSMICCSLSSLPVLVTGNQELQLQMIPVTCIDTLQGCVCCSSTV